MPNTYTKIASVAVGSGGASTMDFTSIPATYTDLLVSISGRCTTSNSNGKLSFNGSTTTFTSRILEADGSSAYSANRSDNLNLFFIDASDQTANTFGSSYIYIPNYASGNNKSFSVDAVTENNATGSYMRLVAGLWSTTSAITSISLMPQGTAFAQYSTATLYGIVKS